MSNSKPFQAGIEFGIGPNPTALQEATRVTLAWMDNLCKQLNTMASNAEQKLFGGSNLPVATTGKHQSIVQDVSNATEEMTRIATAQSIAMIQQAGAALEGYGQKILGTLKGVGSQLVATGSMFADTRRGFASVFGGQEAGDEKFQKAVAIAERTSLLTSDALNLTMTMKRFGADALATTEKVVRMGDEVKTVQLSGIELMNDLIAGSGQDPSMILRRHIPLALTGNIRNLRALFDGAENAHQDMLEKWKKATTGQERWEAIAEIINRQYGGLARIQEGKLSFVRANINDVIENLKGFIGEQLVPEIEPVALAFFNFLNELKENKPFMESMRDIFKDVVGTLAKGAQHIVNFMVRLRDLAVVRPELIKLGLVASTSLGVLLLSLGKVLQLSAGLQSFATFVLPMVGRGLQAFTLSALGPFALKIAAVAAVVAGLKYAIENDIGGLGKVWDSVTTSVKGLWEIISSFSNGTASMSEETAQALEDLGIYDVVVNAGVWLGELKETLVGIFNVIVDSWDRISDILARTVLPVIELVFSIASSVFGVFSDNLLGVVDSTYYASDGVSAFASQWDQTLTTIEGAVVWFDELVTSIQGFVDEIDPLLQFAGWLIKIYGALYLMEQLYVFQMLADMVVSVTEIASVLGEMLSPVLDAIVWAFEAMGFSTSEVTNSIDWLKVAMWALFWPILEPIQLLTWALDGLSWIVQNVGWAMEVLTFFMSPITGIITILIEVIADLGDYFDWLADRWGPTVADTFDFMSDSIANMLDWVVNLTDKLLDMIGASETAKDVLGFVWDAALLLNPVTGPYQAMRLTYNAGEAVYDYFDGESDSTAREYAIDSSIDDSMRVIPTESSSKSLTDTMANASAMSEQRAFQRNMETSLATIAENTRPLLSMPENSSGYSQDGQFASFGIDG